MLTFPWLEGSRLFSILLGTVLAGASFTIAIPTLWWFLPAHRRRLFAASADPRQLLQLALGLVAMALAVANALCRYIPHGPLGAWHAFFFFSTLLLAAAAGPLVLRAARR
jgi:hypothetical protein